VVRVRPGRSGWPSARASWPKAGAGAGGAAANAAPASRRQSARWQPRWRSLWAARASQIQWAALGARATNQWSGRPVKGQLQRRLRRRFLRARAAAASARHAPAMPRAPRGINSSPPRRPRAAAANAVCQHGHNGSAGYLRGPAGPRVLGWARSLVAVQNKLGRLGPVGAGSGARRRTWGRVGRGLGTSAGDGRPRMSSWGRAQARSWGPGRAGAFGRFNQLDARPSRRGPETASGGLSRVYQPRTSGGTSTVYSHGPNWAKSPPIGGTVSPALPSAFIGAGLFG